METDSITPSGTKKQRWDAESLVTMGIQGDKSLVKIDTEATGKPSGEIELHRRLLIELPDTRTWGNVHRLTPSHHVCRL